MASDDLSPLAASGLSGPDLMELFFTFLIALAVIAAAPASSFGQMMFFQPSYLQPAPGGGSTCSDDTASANFLARTGGSAPNYGADSTRYADAICTFIKALETAGIITSGATLGGATSCGTIADVVYLLKAHTSANAALNLCGTSFSLVNHGVTFTTAGYTGAASSYADTQFNPLSGSPNFLVNNASFFVTTSTNFVTLKDYGSIGAEGSGVTVSRPYRHFSDNKFYYEINSNTQSQPQHRSRRTFLRGYAQQFSGRHLLPRHYRNARLHWINRADSQYSRIACR
jgi:hypothetical protein